MTTYVSRHGGISFGNTIYFNRVLPGSVERVWSYLTESNKRVEWLAAGNFDLRKGGKSRLRFLCMANSKNDPTVPDSLRKQHEHVYEFDSEILEIDPPYHLRITWSGHSEVEFKADYWLPDHVMLGVVHKGLNTNDLHNALPSWHAHLESLEAVLGAKDKPDFWAAWKKHYPYYAQLIAESPVAILREYPVPSERVFDAWLTPDVARRWLFTTNESETVRCEIEPRIGGRFEIVDRRANGDILHAGEYIGLRRPHRLVFKFGVPPFDPAAGKVEVDISAQESGCALTVTNSNVPPGLRDKSIEGWTKMLETLERAITAR